MKSLNRPKIIVTGGAGFIGSHTVVALWEVGYEPIILDNFSNAQSWIIDRIHQLTGYPIKAYGVDCTNRKAVEKVVATEGLIHGIIHFAALKSVAESVREPERYFRNNMDALEVMLDVRDAHNIPDFVFSSSATVYGTPTQLPANEQTPRQPALSPYGQTKQDGEDLVLDRCERGAMILRYFNPIGAHPSGLLGELPQGTPQNLVPLLTQTAAGTRDQFTVFGTDYPTPDGSCVRDYIHVMDLARAHVAALTRLVINHRTEIINIGTGHGYSVLEMVEAFEEVTGQRLPKRNADRRPGDVAAIYADCTKANEVLNWKAQYTAKEALQHAWAWEQGLHAVKAVA